MHKRFLLLMFSVFFLNILIWIFLVPLWHFPDEQAHFGQVAYIGETGHSPSYLETKDLTKEIFISEVLLGTVRDNSGNNRFTFHPEYKIPYSRSLEGFYEASIAGMVHAQRQEFVVKEASKYPPLYYLPAALIYKIFYNSDLFVRVYAVRFWSLFLFILNICFVFLIAKMLFSRDKLTQMTLTVMVAFQPMMVFANSGVNSDALGNLLFTVFLYFCTRMIIFGPGTASLVFFVLTVFSCIYAKPQFIMTLPLALLLLILVIFRDMKGKYKIPILIISLVLSGMILFFVNFFRIGPVGVFYQFLVKLDLNSLIKFSAEYTISHTYSEVLPWYFGIYDWLGVTYPRIIHRMINWTILMSIIGLVKYIYLAIKNRKLRNRNFQAGIFLVFVSAVYITAICFYDWLSWYLQGYQLGVQGRYFFPVITVHMLLILLGWRELFSGIKGIKDKGIKLLGIMMISLNCYAIYTVAKTYYTLWPLETFIKQVSQYKPWFVKGWGFVLVFILFVTAMSAFLVEYIKISHDQKKSGHQ